MECSILIDCLLLGHHFSHFGCSQLHGASARHVILQPLKPCIFYCGTKSAERGCGLTPTRCCHRWADYEYCLSPRSFSHTLFKIISTSQLWLACRFMWAGFHKLWDVSLLVNFHLFKLLKVPCQIQENRLRICEHYHILPHYITLDLLVYRFIKGESMYCCRESTTLIWVINHTILAISQMQSFPSGPNEIRHSTLLPYKPIKT